MSELFHQICKNSSKLIRSKRFLDRSKNDPSAFTRNRKLGFTSVFCLVLNILSRTLQIELDDYIDCVLGKHDLSVSKQAFSKARKNIRWEAYEELFKLSAETVMNHYSKNKFCGYRIFAIDGSEFRLDKNQDIDSVFTNRPNMANSKTTVRFSTLTDVLNGFVLSAKIGSIEKAERTFAHEHISEMKESLDSRDIVIFDRGYASKEMVAFMTQQKCKYLMRLQPSSFKAAYNSSKRDYYTEITYEKKSYRIRVIKLRLSTGETETLITNIRKSELKKKNFKKLYSLRWGIETRYNSIKHKLMLERPSGRTVLSVLQDFYANMFLTNCVRAIAVDVSHKINDLKKDCKYSYAPNENLIIGYMKHRLVRIIYSRSYYLIEELLLLALKQPVPIKPGRSFFRSPDTHWKKSGAPKYPV